MGELVKINKYSPHFEKFYFLTGAIKINDFRPIFNYLHSEGKEIVATDGRRLFLIKHELPKGNYELLKRNTREIIFHQTIDNNIKFPNYKLLFPKEWEKHKKIEINIWKKNIYKSYLQIHKILPEKFYLNFDYLKSLNSDSWDIYIMSNIEKKETNFPIIFTKSDKSKIALIMPAIDRDKE